MIHVFAGLKTRSFLAARRGCPNSSACLRNDPFAESNHFDKLQFDGILFRRLLALMLLLLGLGLASSEVDAQATPSLTLVDSLKSHAVAGNRIIFSDGQSPTIDFDISGVPNPGSFISKDATAKLALDPTKMLIEIRGWAQNNSTFSQTLTLEAPATSPITITVIRFFGVLTSAVTVNPDGSESVKAVLPFNPSAFPTTLTVAPPSADEPNALLHVATDQSAPIALSGTYDPLQKQPNGLTLTIGGKQVAATFSGGSKLTIVAPNASISLDGGTVQATSQNLSITIAPGMPASLSGSASANVLGLSGIFSIANDTTAASCPTVTVTVAPGASLGQILSFVGPLTISCNTIVGSVKIRDDAYAFSVTATGLTFTKTGGAPQSTVDLGAASFSIAGPISLVFSDISLSGSNAGFTVSGQPMLQLSKDESATAISGVSLAISGTGISATCLPAASSQTLGKNLRFQVSPLCTGGTNTPVDGLRIQVSGDDLPAPFSSNSQICAELSKRKLHICGSASATNSIEFAKATKFSIGDAVQVSNASLMISYDDTNGLALSGKGLLSVSRASHTDLRVLPDASEYNLSLSYNFAASQSATLTLQPTAASIGKFLGLEIDCVDDTTSMQRVDCSKASPISASFEKSVTTVAFPSLAARPAFVRFQNGQSSIDLTNHSKPITDGANDSETSDLDIVVKGLQFVIDSSGLKSASVSSIATPDCTPQEIPPDTEPKGKIAASLGLFDFKSLCFSAEPDKANPDAKNPVDVMFSAVVSPDSPLVASGDDGYVYAKFDNGVGAAIVTFQKGLLVRLGPETVTVTRLAIEFDPSHRTYEAEASLTTTSGELKDATVYFKSITLTEALVDGHWKFQTPHAALDSSKTAESFGLRLFEDLVSALAIHSFGILK